MTGLFDIYASFYLQTGVSESMSNRLGVEVEKYNSITMDMMQYHPLVMITSQILMNMDKTIYTY